MVKKSSEKKLSKQREYVTRTIDLSDISMIDVSNAKVLKERICEDIKVANELVIEASSIERITTPGTQILLSCAASMRKKRGRFILKHSQPLGEVFVLMGLGHILEEWKNI